MRRTLAMLLILATTATLTALVNPAFVVAQSTGTVDVKAFGAKGDGQTDDSQAIQDAANAANQRTIAFQPSGGAYLGSSPPVYFPAGHYKISKEIQFGAYANVLSDAGAIIEQTEACRSFVFPGGYTVAVTGLRFLGGTNQIYFDNANVDTTTIFIDQCEFQLSKEFAIYTIGTTDGHLSANLIVDRCKFILPHQVLHNVCDGATVRDCWVTVGASNFAPDSAAFVNRSGVLTLENMLGVPVFEKSQDHPRVRWIDNHDQLLVNRSRFGGEFAGIPIVHHFGKPAAEYPWMGQNVTIENSQISAGPGRGPDSGVLTLRGGVPQIIRFVGNRYLVDSPFIRVDGLELDTFLQALPKAEARLQIEIDSNMAFPSEPAIPKALEAFLR